MAKWPRSLDRAPFYLVDKMKDGGLKRKLQSCSNGPFRKIDVLHRTPRCRPAVPEHTKESYVAAARMGAGILECDVTFTQGRRARLPARPMRLAYDDQHPRDALGLQVHAGLHASRFDATGKLIRPRRPNAAPATSP